MHKYGWEPSWHFNHWILTLLILICFIYWLLTIFLSEKYQSIIGFIFFPVIAVWHIVIILEYWDIGGGFYIAASRFKYNNVYISIN